jgi:hypothetical protein
MADPGISYSPSGAPASSTPPVAQQQKLRVELALKNSASWFVVIAALSILNSVLAMSGASIHFIFGLGLTQIVDGIAHQVGSAGYVLDFVINGIIAGLFVLIWHFARKGHAFPWYGGMALYVIDGLLLLLFKDYLSAAFHAWALYRMSPGLKLIPVLKQLNQTTATGAVSSTYTN